jgi:hypothetical protein
VQIDERTDELKRLNEQLQLLNESLQTKIGERTRAERTLQKRLAFERLLSETSARFIMIPPERLDAEIEECLRQILVFFKIDRCGMVRTLPGKQSFKIVHMTEVENVPPNGCDGPAPAAIFVGLDPQVQLAFLGCKVEINNR